MMEEFCLKTPISLEGRVIIPVVRESVSVTGDGGIVMVSPIALLIEESGTCFFVPLEENIGLSEVLESMCDEIPDDGGENL